MRVAVDAMGGDNAPTEIVRGALQALTRIPDLHVLLVGEPATVEAALDAEGPRSDRVSIQPASQMIVMGESPVEALRRKPDTSIQRCMEALRDGHAEAVVSAGDTGGVVVSATMFASRLKGVRRHGIAIPVPTREGGRALLIDVGANIQTKPVHLLQYAIMASAYAREIMGVEKPRVGLLSVGEEEAKGTDLTRKARDLIAKSDLHFVGNIEGQAIFSGAADVIVCDGFVGNVVLKVSEGLVESFLMTILAQVDQDPAGGARIREFVGGLRARLDYSSTGGAPLLGVEGSVIICHGRSKATAIANAIQVASDFMKSGVNERIVEEVGRVSALHRATEFLHLDRN